ncbi:MAG: hypothetical protein VYD19_01900 [Myxococcota bacterium]|nr:hypothetical protein [Myxococcota bacterium]
MHLILLISMGLFLLPAVVAGAALDLFFDLSRGGATSADILRGGLFTVLGGVAIWLPLRRARALRRAGTARGFLEKLFSHAEPIMVVGALSGVALVSHLNEEHMQRLRAEAAVECAQIAPTQEGAGREACLEAALTCYHQVRSADGPLMMRRRARAQCLEEWKRGRAPASETKRR